MVTDEHFWVNWGHLFPIKTRHVSDVVLGWISRNLIKKKKKIEFAQCVHCCFLFFFKSSCIAFSVVSFCLNVTQLSEDNHSSELFFLNQIIQVFQQELKKGVYVLWIWPTLALVKVFPLRTLNANYKPKSKWWTSLSRMMKQHLLTPAFVWAILCCTVGSGGVIHDVRILKPAAMHLPVHINPSLHKPVDPGTDTGNAAITPGR